MATLDPSHPCLVWLWLRAQFSEEDRRTFIGLVEKYETLKSAEPRIALDLLESIFAMTTRAGDVVGWYYQQRRILGYPLSWTMAP